MMELRDAVDRESENSCRSPSTALRCYGEPRPRDTDESVSSALPQFLIWNIGASGRGRISAVNWDEFGLQPQSERSGQHKPS